MNVTWMIKRRFEWDDQQNGRSFNFVEGKSEAAHWRLHQSNKLSEETSVRISNRHSDHPKTAGPIRSHQINTRRWNYQNSNRKWNFGQFSKITDRDHQKTRNWKTQNRTRIWNMFRKRTKIKVRFLWSNYRVKSKVYGPESNWTVQQGQTGVQLLDP